MEVYGEGESNQGLSPIFRMDKFVNDACRICQFSVIRI
jgi:hypothetical protein